GVALVLAAGVRELPQEIGGRPAYRGRDVDVAHHVDSVILRVCGGNDRHQRHGEQKPKSNAHFSSSPKSWLVLCDSTDPAKRSSTRRASERAMVDRCAWARRAARSKPRLGQESRERPPADVVDAGKGDAVAHELV